MAGCVQGAKTRIAFDGQEIEFLSLIDNSVHGLVDNSRAAIRGIYEAYDSRVSAGLKRFRFKLKMNPSPSEMDKILGVIGTNESPTDTFSVVDGSSDSVAPTPFDVIIDRVTKVHTYANCYVNSFTLTGQKGDKPVELELDIIGTSETEANAGTFSATAIGAPDIAYAFTEGTIKLGTAVGNGSDGLVEFDRFALVWSNNLEVQYNNSQTATAICATNRTIDLLISTPYTSTEQALYTDPAASTITGFSSPDAYLKFTRSASNISTLYTFGNIKSLAQPPDIPGRTEVRLAQAYRAYTTSSAAALVVTHDATTAS